MRRQIDEQARQLEDQIVGVNAELVALDCVFRVTWALISRDAGQAFHVISGIHFTALGSLVDRFHRFSLVVPGQAFLLCSFFCACFLL